MRLGTRARIGLFVSLGILAGVGFVGLPGILVGPPHATITAKSNGSNSTSSSSNFAGQGATPGTLTRVNMSRTQQIPSSDQPVSFGTLTGLVSLVIIPATAISLVASLFVARHSRKPQAKILSDQV